MESELTSIRQYVCRLEQFAERCGVPVVRNCLQANVLGRVEQRRIVLRTGLSLEQQLLTLVHELTHLTIHRNAWPAINRTICEYEAEAVERWVGAVLGVRPWLEDEFDASSITEDLLACSVLRVRWAALKLLNVARECGLPADQIPLETQTAVEVDASSREKVIFDDELRGMRDFIGHTKPL